MAVGPGFIRVSNPPRSFAVLLISFIRVVQVSDMSPRWKMVSYAAPKILPK